MKKKIRFLVDEDIRFIFDVDDRIDTVANFATFEDADLEFGAVDEQVLSAGQRMDRLILTKDKGSGFSKRTIFNPSYSKTGVVVVTARPQQAPFVVIKLARSFSHNDLVGARTEANINLARIKRSSGSYIVEFE